MGTDCFYSNESMQSDTFTTAGSHTKFANESATPPVLMSTPYGAPSPIWEPQNVIIQSFENWCSTVNPRKDKLKLSLQPGQIETEWKKWIATSCTLIKLDH